MIGYILSPVAVFVCEHLSHLHFFSLGIFHKCLTLVWLCRCYFLCIAIIMIFFCHHHLSTHIQTTIILLYICRDVSLNSYPITNSFASIHLYVIFWVLKIPSVVSYHHIDHANLVLQCNLNTHRKGVSHIIIRYY